MYYPKITIITPSFNQGDYIENTIESILNQKYPNLEYIIIDGGSTDSTIEILQKFNDQINYWVSESDNGQANAINKGLRLATGDWVGWQNSDDIYYPGTFFALANEINKTINIDVFIGNINLIDQNDEVLHHLKYVEPTFKSLLAEGMVMANQATFWKNNVINPILMNENFHYNFDYEFFIRLLHDKKSKHINKTLGALRVHNETKTFNNPNNFIIENKIILLDYNHIGYNKYYYLLRRFLLTLNKGNFSYAFKGIFNRLLRK